MRVTKRNALETAWITVRVAMMENVFAKKVGVEQCVA